MKKILRAIHAFIRICIEEKQGVDYIERLARFAQICRDDETYELATSYFDNYEMLELMNQYLEKREN